VDPLLSPASHPALAVSDGTTPDGNPSFFWLPPIAANPSTSGTPNMGLASAVVVRVCPGEAVCSSAAALAEFTDAGGTGGASVTLGDEHYQVDWKTSENSTGASLAGQTVRIWVLLGKVPVDEQVQVGFIDVTFASDGKQARGRSGDALREGRALPLRFRMESGVAFGGDCLGSDGPDCVEFVASDGGFEECTVESGACLTADEGWLPDDFEGPVLVQVVQEPLVDGACFDGLPLPQREACYRITTVPDFGGAEFNGDVFFSMCQEAGIPANFEIHQRTGSGEVRRPVGLAGPVPGLDCSAFAFASMTPLSRFAVRLGEFLFGRPLHASDGLTARLSSFSEFFWAPAAEFASVTAPATADPDETVAVQLQLGLDHGVSGDLEGITVEIEVDGGSLSPGGTYLSDANGGLSSDWTLPSDPGLYTLVATIPVLVESLGVERSISWLVEVVEEGPPSGDVFGNVFDVNSNAIVGATVSTPGVASVLTTVNGTYVLTDVPVGPRGIEVDVTGFRSVIAYVDVPAGQSVGQDFELPASTAPFALDEVHDPVTGTTGSCIGGPDFQGFTPGVSPLGRVELRARANGGFPGGGTSNTIHIRDGSPSGPILASATTQVQAAGGADVWADFQFDPALVTEVGQVLVIEWDLAGTELSWYQQDPGTYPDGGGFDCFGNADTRDRSFRTSSFLIP
jgi:hypothetical protein